MPSTARSAPPSLLELYLRERKSLVLYFSAKLKSRAAAEDLIQDLYVRVCAGETPPTAENPAAFLFRAASNLMLDRLRGEGRASRREDAWARAVQGEAGQALAPTPEQAAADRQRLARLLDAVESLPPQTQKAFRLHKLDGLTYAETALAMGVSAKTVEKQIGAALKRLAERLGETRP